MDRIKKIAGGVGKVMLALLGGVLMPILLWVALGAAITQKIRERRARRVLPPSIGEILKDAGLNIREYVVDKEETSPAFTQQPVPDVDELLHRNGFTFSEDAAPKHCWEVLYCPLEKRGSCPAYARRVIPDWMAMGLNKNGKVDGKALNTLPTCSG